MQTRCRRMMRMGGISLLLGWLLLALPVSLHARSAPTDELAQRQAEKLEAGEVEQYWDRLMKEYGGYFPETRLPSFKELLDPGGESFPPVAVIKALLRFFFHEVTVNGKLLSAIVILTVFSMILETLQSAFEKKAVSKIGYSIVYMVLIVIAVNSFNIAIGYAKEAISSMIHFLIAIVPLLLSLLAATGGVATVTILHPLVIFMIHTMGSAVTFVVFPLLFFSVVLNIVSTMSDIYRLTRMAALMQKIAVGLMGLFVTVFLGVLTVQGATGAVTDGVAIRTAKYVTGNFVPVVGRMFSDAADTVVSASLLVKNAVGLAGVVILILLCAFPAVKILTLALIYHLSAAVMQPMGESPIVKCLETIGKSMIYVFAALAAVGFLFFLAVSIIIATSNVSVMIR